ncbi:MAG: arylsulfatase [Kordiimonadaceae bacterium]|jgi:arylsulfatase A|nr:arylsulfatase [Kordiimonadaceae bacterium]MBT6036584.1 arylsulfatase [Kordiimonadaceae bacterium]MBT6328874.1 arylsulfatase [Kordiimonadaceae bacterium]
MINKIILTLIAIFLANSAFAQSRKPNVIIINADDIGYGDLSAYGATKVRTPNIDQLANDGISFTDAHSASAVCSPSRYGLITGQYPARKDYLWGPLMLKEPLSVEVDQLTIADVMKEAGYKTAIIGKWHLGFGGREELLDWNKPLDPGPLELGFDYYYGVPVLNSHPPFVYVENHNVVGLVPEDPLVYDTRSITREFDEKFGLEVIGGGDAAHELYKDREIGTNLKDRAIKWIKENKDDPFFLYFATTNIHHPFTPAPRFIASSDAGPYGDAIHELDWMVGEITRTLDEEGLTNDTLLIFTSDNGGMFNRGGQTAWEAGHRMNGKLLGMKFGAWEGGHRVPFIVRWPGNAPAGKKSAELLSNVDVIATLADLVGRDLKEHEGPDSVNMMNAFKGIEGEPLRDELIISPFYATHLTIRSGKWAYISAQDEGGFEGTRIGQHLFAGAAAVGFTGQINSDIVDGKIKEGAAPAQLYDLDKDPYQTTNVYYDNPDIVEKLKAMMTETMSE